jgi:outer membrane receptor protein involved in Fe transport
MKKILTLLVFLGFVSALRAQDGDISGKVTDDNGEGVPIASVQIVDAKHVPTGRGAQTDFDGNYSIKPLTPGRYNIMVTYVGYETQVQEGVVVSSDKTTFLDIKMKTATKELKEVQVVAYKVPLIDPGKTSDQNTVTSEEIATMSTKNIDDIAATTAGVFQADQGGGLNIKGGRGDATQYYVDGVKINGTPTIPASSIEQLQVITGGIPAKYGDVVGGIVNITSKGPASEWHGGAEGTTTQYLDAFGYNLVNANVTGPIWKDKKTKKTIMGLFLAFEYEHQKDPNPSAIGVWQVRPNVLDSLEQYPLLKSQTSTGFNLRANEVTYADMFKQQVKPNTQEADYRGNARLDIRPADNITLTFGGSMTYTNDQSWVEQYTLFNPSNNPTVNTLDYRVYGRFTHNIQSKQAAEDEKEGKRKKASAFQNAYYSVQVDYEKYEQKTYGAGGTNPFNYGYIGKFDVKQAPVFSYDTFAVGNKIYTGYKQVGIADTAVIFTPANVNPYSTRFTEEYYELLGATPNANGSYEVYGANNANFTSNLNEIQSNQGLINGERSTIVNNIWYNTGRTYDGFGDNANNDQYRVRLEGAFDVLKPGAPSRNKHSFEFGVEYEQRIQRSYFVSPLEVWQRARDLVNLQLTNFDRSNPIFRINGVNYSANDPNRPAFYLTDSILLNNQYVDTAQSWFDKSLRKSLGMAQNSTNLLNVDAYTPSQLNIKMFSPDNLLGDGSAIVSYMGYDPYGNVLTTQPSFNDFFTKMDANGNMIRAIPAYRPIYTAGYISDRFYFKDLTFNVGLRVDRFDANQEVLIDQYSLYPIYTAGEVTNIGGNEFTRPADIGSNYYVYVNNSEAPTAIAGYRNGNTWYDKYGNALANGLALASASSTGTIQPYLVNPNEDIKNAATFNPNQSFTAYKPEIIAMPRLQFSFNLTDQALFFAHYDILTQRPTDAEVEMNPTQYLFFVDNIGGVLNNPNLQPQRTVDYELGFKQKVSNSAAFTISAFYREFRDQIEVQKIVDAYPKDYITYGNIDFGTTKGFSLDFDMRRTANFTLKANYTLQFADGTGSDPTTQLGLISANDPNFRTIAPLDYDARHLVNVNVSYSYGVGRDYNGPVTKKNKQVLSDAGISLQLTARSGTPYTEESNVVATDLLNNVARAVSEGSINGSRLPWYFRLNMRVWKNFNFTVGKKKEKSEDRRPVALEIYLQIQNLLNTENVIGVYRYTGVAGDDGFLSSPISLPAIQASLNPQAFKDQYAAVINTPTHYSLPRRIYLGAVFSF